MITIPTSPTPASIKTPTSASLSLAFLTGQASANTTVEPSSPQQPNAPSGVTLPKLLSNAELVSANATANVEVHRCIVFFFFLEYFIYLFFPQIIRRSHRRLHRKIQTDHLLCHPLIMTKCRTSWHGLKSANWYVNAVWCGNHQLKKAIICRPLLVITCLFRLWWLPQRIPLHSQRSSCVARVFSGASRSPSSTSHQPTFGAVCPSSPLATSARTPTSSHASSRKAPEILVRSVCFVPNLKNFVYSSSEHHPDANKHSRSL